MEQEVADALARIPLYADIERGSIVTERLGGLTNRNYRIDSAAGSHVLRLAGEGSGDYIDRAAEKYNATIAAAAGVNAEVLHFDVERGTMLCRYIDACVTMGVERFRDTARVHRAGVAFHRLHTCGKRFQGEFELFEQIDNYLGVVRKLGASVPEGYDEVHRDAAAVREALAAQRLPNAPCHCDPLAENLLDTGERMYIIDFEYAGNNDPMWDLGDLSVEAAFSEAQDEALLQAYFDGEPHPYDVGRMVMYKAMCDLLWTLWGVVQHANDNPAEDFWAYAATRLERCRALMADSAFPRHLAAVNRGP